MAWEGLIGHEEQREMLRRSVARGRLGQTYLFAGPSGIGKRRFALGLAECLLCEKQSENNLDACGVCSGCKQVRALSHPDLLRVDCPEGKSELPLELFLGSSERRGKEGLCFELSLKPMSGRYKIAIINDAELLNDEGANALLKTLEEPPPHSLLILLATTPDALLQTIRSRCQIVRFSPLPTAAVRELLLREGMTDDPDQATEIAELSQGSLDTAAELLETHLGAQRIALFDLLSASPFQSQRIAAQVLSALEEVGTESSTQRNFAGWTIRFCIQFYHRSLLALAGTPSRPAEIPQIAKYVSRFQEPTPEVFESIGELLERCITAERQLDRKVSTPLCLEALFDDLGHIGRRYAPAG